MVKRLSFVMILMFSFVMAVCAKDNDAGLNYDIEGAGTATQGSYMVKVTVITKDKKISMMLLLAVPFMECFSKDLVIRS